MRAECRLACARYALALPAHPLGGQAGDRLGRGTGSSLEFMDFRDYVPGDDLRHVDWRTYARTDQLKVRLYREEVSPTVEIIVDDSVAMGVTEVKEQALRDLVDAVSYWVRAAGGTARPLAAGGDLLDALDGTWSLGDGPRGNLAPIVPLRPRTIRWVLSDFLVPHDPAPMARRLSEGAAKLVGIQVLDPWELDPTRDGPSTLVETSTDERLDLMLDRTAITAYRDRLARLRSALSTAFRRVGGTFVTVRAAPPEIMFRRDLLRAGLLEPTG